MKKILSLFLILVLFLIQNTCFAVINDGLSVKREELILKSELKKKYLAYEYIITNQSRENIEIKNAQVINGISGTVAFNANEEGAKKSIGRLWIVMGPLGLFTLGLGWVAGVLGTPIAAIKGHLKKNKIEKESENYKIDVSVGILQPQESIRIKILTTFGTSPQLKLTAADPKTGKPETVIY